MRMTMSIVAVLMFVLAGAAAAQDYDGMLKQATFSLSEAISRAMKEAKSGRTFEVELERDAGRTVYSVDIAQGAEVLNIVLNAVDGSIVAREREGEDHSAIVAAARIPLSDAIKTATGKIPGKAVHARLAMNGKIPEARVLVVGDRDGKTAVVIIDAASGNVLSAADSKEAPDADELDERFTATFGEDLGDLGPTGTNPYFILDPGWFIELSGQKGDDQVTIAITVLDVTKVIAGVETRAVEEKEIVNGQVRESTRDYFAISKKTNNVYYFGEDVDVYENGKLVGHEGAWLAGLNGARFGLFMPAVPLLGARYYQEIAPGVALDRGEITSLTEKLECPAGSFENVLEVVETSDLEKDVAERNLYVRGIGVVMDDDLKLTRYGRKK